jgi:predicted RNase H-like HicB family nuclease
VSRITGLCFGWRNQTEEEALENIREAICLAAALALSHFIWNQTQLN